VLLPVAGVLGAVEGGLAAGVVTTLAATALRDRQDRKARVGAVAEALAEVDRTVRGPDGVGLPDLDRNRRDLLGRAWRSGRLDKRAAATLRRINAHLDDLLIRLVEGELEADASHLVRATVTRYLPDTLEPFLALNDPRAVVRGRPATAEVADQLASIEKGLAEMARRPSRNHPRHACSCRASSCDRSSVKRRSESGDPDHRSQAGRTAVRGEPPLREEGVRP
jgi:hypothetical protein